MGGLGYGLGGLGNFSPNFANFLENFRKGGETLAAHYDNFLFVVQRLNMNVFCDFHDRVAF